MLGKRVKGSKLGQILCADKTGFCRLSHIFNTHTYTHMHTHMHDVHTHKGFKTITNPPLQIFQHIVLLATP